MKMSLIEAQKHKIDLLKGEIESLKIINKCICDLYDKKNNTIKDNIDEKIKLFEKAVYDEEGIKDPEEKKQIIDPELVAVAKFLEEWLKTLKKTERIK